MNKEEALKNANLIDCDLTSMTASDLVEEIYEDEIDNNYENKIKELENTVMWLCGYVMEFHEHRNQLLQINKDTKSLDSVIDHIIMQFPQLQGTKNQKVFEQLGKIVNSSENSKDVDNVLKNLVDKYL